MPVHYKLYHTYSTVSLHLLFCSTLSLSLSVFLSLSLYLFLSLSRFLSFSLSLYLFLSLSLPLYFSPSTSFCLCFSCLAAICSAFFTYKIRPPMGRPTAALRLSYHCWPPGRLQKDRGSAKYIRSFGHHHSLRYSAPARKIPVKKGHFQLLLTEGFEILCTRRKGIF